MTGIQMIVGIALGSAVAYVYFRMLSAQVKSIAGGERPAALMGLGFLARMALLGGCMAGLLAWAYPAGVAFALAFLLARAWLIQRVRAEAKQAGDEKGQKPPEAP